MEILKASNLNFNCFPSEESNFLSYDQIVSGKFASIPLLKDVGFIVVKNVISKKNINQARDTYFNLFENGEYEKNDNWVHLKDHKDSHGCNNHPSKLFLDTEEFHSIVKSPKLINLSKIILRTNKSTISPRMIVRSFSNLSKRCTYAHRDKEYFKSANPQNVATCWIPLGPVGKDYGQLIYLSGSQKKELIIDNLVNQEKIISKNLNQLSDQLKLRWIRPLINEGDVIFHSLEIVHASFDSNSNIPRLSIDIRFSSSKADNDPRWSSSWRGDDGL